MNWKEKNELLKLIKKLMKKFLVIINIEKLINNNNKIYMLSIIIFSCKTCVLVLNKKKNGKQKTLTLNKNVLKYQNQPTSYQCGVNC